MDLILLNEDLVKNSTNDPVVYVSQLGCHGNFRPLKMFVFSQLPPSLASVNLVHLSCIYPVRTLTIPVLFVLPDSGTPKSYVS